VAEPGSPTASTVNTPGALTAMEDITVVNPVLEI